MYGSLSPSNALELASLTLFPAFFIECDKGASEIEVTGPSTTRVNVPTPESGKEGDSTSLQIAVKCGNITSAIQEIPYYYNDALEEVPTTLLSNFSGTGKEKSCELIEGTTLLVPETGSLASMFTVLY